jgi:hypothetical protein
VLPGDFALAVGGEAGCPEALPAGAEGIPPLNRGRRESGRRGGAPLGRG